MADDSDYDSTASEYGYPAAEAQKTFGLDPAIQRSNLLPYYSKATGWVAPQALYAAVKGLLAPGEAMKGHQPTMEDAIGTANMIGSGGLSASAAMPGSVPRGALGMTVYHGTHKIFPATEANPLGEFSLDKIGTGQGAQAFGHGIYTAESPDVAKMYRRGAAPIVVAGGKYFDTATQQYWRVDPQHLANKVTQWAADSSRGNPFTQMPGLLERLYKDKYNSISPTVYEGAKRILRKWQSQDAMIKPGGSLYHADLPDPRVAQMLDWDRTLYEQPKGVQRAFRQAWMDVDKPASGQQFPETGEDIYNFLGTLAGRGENNDRFASQYLLDKDIPGTSFLDGFSRARSGDRLTQSRNFVLFDPSAARITRREARGGLVKGSGGIMQALAEGGPVGAAPSSGGYEPTETNPMIDAISKALGWARDKANVVPLPELLGGGAGNFLMGTSPEEIHAWAQGDSPFMQNQFSDDLTNYGRVKPERADSVLSTAMLPWAAPVVAARGAGAGLRALGNVPMDMSRRAFLQKAGATAGAGALAMTGLGLLKDTAKEAAPAVAEHVKVAPVQQYIDHLTAAELADSNAANTIEFKLGGEHPRDIGLGDHLELRTDHATKLRAMPAYKPYTDAQEHLQSLVDDYFMHGYDHTAQQKMEAAEKLYDSQFGKGFSDYVLNAGQNHGYAVSHDEAKELLNRFYGPNHSQMHNNLHSPDMRRPWDPEDGPRPRKPNFGAAVLGGALAAGAGKSERDTAFHALADAQRGKPEMAMLRAQDAAHLPDRVYPESYNALTYAMEHVGDLTHRMSEKSATYHSSKMGLEFVAPKIRTGLRVVENPVDARRIAQIPTDKFPELQAYADAHAKLPVYNEAQQAARDAAVHLGQLNLPGSARALRKLQKMIDDGTYEQIAGSYDPEFEKRPPGLVKGGGGIMRALKDAQ